MGLSHFSRKYLEINHSFGQTVKAAIRSISQIKLWNLAWESFSIFLTQKNKKYFFMIKFNMFLGVSKIAPASFWRGAKKGRWGKKGRRRKLTILDFLILFVVNNHFSPFFYFFQIIFVIFFACWKKWWGKYKTTVLWIPFS